MVLDNLRRVFGAAVPPGEIERLAQAHYAHLAQLGIEFFKFRWFSAQRKRALVRVENLDAFVTAFRKGKGVLILTGHFGNFELGAGTALVAFGGDAGDAAAFAIGLHAVQLLPTLVMGGLLLGTFRKPAPAAPPAGAQEA